MAISYTKTNWKNGEGQPISKANLDHIEDGIYNATEGVNTNASVLASLAAQVNLSNTYSLTDEVAIGTWVDGKTIYRKCCQINSLPNATYQVYSFSTYGIAPDKITNLYGMCYNSSGDGTFPFNIARPDNTNSSIGLWRDNTTQFKIHVGTANRSSWSAIVVVEYTKASS